MKDQSELLLGPEALQCLLPHRPPILMVDGVTHFSAEDLSITAYKDIAQDEEVFAGHFPGAPIWPGVYTVEGLAQTCLLLTRLLQLSAVEREELSLAKQESSSASPPSALFDRLAAKAEIGVLAAVDLRWRAPVLPGQRLVYLVTRTHLHSTVGRFEVEARVDQESVASGSLTAKG